jgi:hypothetical protein
MQEEDSHRGEVNEHATDFMSMLEQALPPKSTLLTWAEVMNADE